MKTVFKNLAENTIRHNPSKSIRMAQIQITEKENMVEIIYNDHGAPFTGDINKLWKLFYKHESQIGSGIGLYIMKHLLKKMKGSLEIKTQPNLIFIFQFQRGEVNE